jgi:allophanate hydrolase subunit 2
VSGAPGLVEVLAGGPFTTVQDLPGRVGYWHVGVPPNGPMDDLAHRLVTAVLGNDPSAAALELTGSGPSLRFTGKTLLLFKSTHTTHTHPHYLTCQIRSHNTGRPVTLQRVRLPHRTLPQSSPISISTHHTPIPKPSNYTPQRRP